MSAIRVFIADDHAVLRSGLRLLLDAEPDIEVVGDCATGEEAVRAVVASPPDVVLMDISMPGGGGLAATERIRQQCRQVKVLVLTMHDDEGYLRQFLRAGASGYVLKKAADTELTAAIRAVHGGDVYIYPSVARALVSEYLGERRPEPGGQKALAGLTRRELEVLQLVARGHTNQETADRLFVSVKTIETHRANIMRKLGVSSRAQLVRFALDNGLLEGPE